MFTRWNQFTQCCSSGIELPQTFFLFWLFWCIVTMADRYCAAFFEHCDCACGWRFFFFVLPKFVFRFFVFVYYKNINWLENGVNIDANKMYLNVIFGQKNKKVSSVHLAEIVHSWKVLQEVHKRCFPCLGDFSSLSLKKSSKINVHSRHQPLWKPGSLER